MPTLEEYLKEYGISPAHTEEETINIILEHLSKNHQIQTHLRGRDELIAISATILVHLRKIRDPVRLFKNLGIAFEMRGWCIYTNSVRNAFNRLWTDAVHQGKQKEILAVWSSFTNKHTQVQLMRSLPRNVAHSFFAKESKRNKLDREGPVIDDVLTREFVLRKDTSKKTAEKLIHSEQHWVRLGALEGFVQRPDVSLSEVKSLLRHQKRRTVVSIVSGLARRKNLGAKDISDLFSGYASPTVAEFMKAFLNAKGHKSKLVARLREHPLQVVSAGVKDFDAFLVAGERSFIGKKAMLRVPGGKKKVRNQMMFEKTRYLRR